MDSAQFNALIDRAKKKDEQAMCILAKYCVNAIRMHLSVKFGNRPEIEDWAHDVFTYKILSNLPDKIIKRPLAWLNKIAENYVFTVLKNEAVSVEFVEDIADNGDLSDKVDNLMVKEASKCVKKIDWLILVLKYYHGYKFEEIAKMLKMKPATVRQRALRARHIFKNSVTFSE